MHRFLLTVAAASSILAIGLLVPNCAEAIPSGIPLVVNPIENVAFCFYANGWNGPGLYECGYQHRRGEGWHGRREERREEYRMHRREDHREDHHDHDQLIVPIPGPR